MQKCESKCFSKYFIDTGQVKWDKDTQTHRRACRLESSSRAGRASCLQPPDRASAQSLLPLRRQPHLKHRRPFLVS